VVLLTNRVHPTRENHKIAEVRPAVHDAVMKALGLAVEALPRSKRFFQIIYLKAPIKDSGPLAAWPLERKVLGYGPRPQILKEPKFLYQSPSGTSGCESIQVEVDSSPRGRWLGPASDQLGVDAHLPEGHPSLRSWVSAAKNHATQLIAESVCLFRIGSVAKFSANSKIPAACASRPQCRSR